MGKKKSKAKQQQRRSYQGGLFSRLNSDWVALSTSADSEVWSNLRTLRNRSRDLIRNNDYANGALRTILANVLGDSGIRMQSKVPMQRGQKLNDSLNSTIEGLWERWHKAAYCDVGGRLSWQQFERLALRSVVESGEVLIRKVYKEFRGSPVPFALQIIEADQLADEHGRTLRAADGNQIRMGVELDQYMAPVAYWIYPYHPGDNWVYPSGGENRYTPVRVPADEIIHLYISDRPGQTRGVPWFASCINRLRHMSGYEEAEIIKARSQACTMGFIQTPDPGAYGTEVEGSSNRQIGFEPGIIQALEPGEIFNGFAPTSPNQSLDPFLRFMLRGVSAGSGVGYEALARDYSQTSYSSQRASMLEERDLWRTVQSWLYGALHQSVYESWMDAAVMSGALALPQYEPFKPQYNQPSWIPRGWLWIDPSKDVAASVEAITAGLSTLGRELASQGLDLDELMQERQREIELLKAAGVGVSVYPETAPQPEQPQAGQEGQPAEQPKQIPEGFTPVRSIEPQPHKEENLEITINLDMGDLTKSVTVSPDQTVLEPTPLIPSGLTPVRAWDGYRAPKKCKAKPCGNTCIAKGKACLAGLSPEQKKLAQKAAKAMQAGTTPVAAPLPNAPAIASTPVQQPPSTTATPVADKPKAAEISINRKELDKKRQELVDKFGDVDVENAEANVKKLLADGGIYMKVPNSEVMALVLGDKFKTAHEIGGRPGAPPPGTGEGDYLAARARVEKKVCGVPDDTDGADRPKYGYIGSKDLNSAEHLEVGGAYGNITVEFKDEVRSRSTFTGADSFKSGIASKIDEPNAASLVTLTRRGIDQPIGNLQDAQLIRAANSKSIAELAGHLAPTGNAYLEAQVHGQLTPSDVKALHFRPSGVHDSPTPELAKLAKEKGIDLYVNGKKVDPDTITEPKVSAKAKPILDSLQKGDIDGFESAVASLDIEAANRIIQGKRSADVTQDVLAEAAGYAKKPKKVSAEKFDELAASGKNIVLYRGVQDSDPLLPGRKKASAEDIQNQLKDGDYYSGNGIYGNGNYFAHSSVSKNGVIQKGTSGEQDEVARRIATNYAGDKDNKNNPKGRVVRAVLSEDAKVATDQQVIGLQKQYAKKFDGEIERKKQEVLAKAKPYTKAEADKMRQEVDDFRKTTKISARENLLTSDWGFNGDIKQIQVVVEAEYPSGKAGKLKKEKAYFEVYEHPDGTTKIDFPDPEIVNYFKTKHADKVKVGVFSIDFQSKDQAKDLLQGMASDNLIKSVKGSKIDPEAVEGGYKPKDREKAEKAVESYRTLKSSWGLDEAKNSVSSRFAIAMGIDAIVPSGQAGGSSSNYINILNRSKLVMDETIYKTADIYDRKKKKGK